MIFERKKTGEGIWAKTGEQVDVLSGRGPIEKSAKSRFDEPAHLEVGNMVMINSTIDLVEEETFDEQQWIWIE